MDDWLSRPTDPEDGSATSWKTSFHLEDFIGGEMELGKLFLSDLKEFGQIYTPSAATLNSSE